MKLGIIESAILAIIPCTIIYARFARIRLLPAFLLSLIATLTALAMVAYHERHEYRQQLGLRGSGSSPEEGMMLIATGLFFLVLAAFGARLYQKWIAGDLTADERLPGAPGFRAWLRWSNLVCVLALSACLALGWGYSFVGCLVLFIIVLIGYPALNTSGGKVPLEPLVSAHSRNERDRILKMLDEGKITAAESADLLNALGNTEPSRVISAPVSSASQRLVLIGAACVLLGFFLPWFTMNPGAELSRMMGSLSQMMNSPSHGSGLPEMNVPTIKAVVQVSGGDVGRGLGWAVLLLAAAVAALPYVATNIDRPTQRTLRLLMLGVGGVIALYLFTSNLRYVSIGIVLVIAGYTLEGMGLMKEASRFVNAGTPAEAPSRELDPQP